MGERGQAWSMDLVIGVLIFLLVAGVIYAFLIDRDKNDITPLRIESEVIATKLTTDSSIAVAENNQLDVAQMITLSDEDYEQLKKQLGVNREFCVFLQDDRGNLVFINASGKKVNGIGSSTGEINLSGCPCGSAIDDGGNCILT